MPIITLTTDLGLKDYYVASLKGNILSQLPDVNIVDITHNVPLYDSPKAAFIIRNCYRDFPKGTIHIIGVESELNDNSKHVVIFNQEQYFIGADNGMFSLIFDNPPEKAVELSIPLETDKITFPTRDVFVKAACHIARGETLEVLGKPINELNYKISFQAITQDNIIKGVFNYIDNYGNLHSNIHESLFNNFGKGRRFSIYLRRSQYQINELSKTYNEVPESNIVILFNTSGFLEIAMNRASANKLLGLNIMDSFTIEFYD